MNNIVKAILTCVGAFLIQCLFSLIESEVTVPLLIWSIVLIIVIGIIFLFRRDLKPIGIGLLLCAAIDLGYTIFELSQLKG